MLPPLPLTLAQLEVAQKAHERGEEHREAEAYVEVLVAVVLLAQSDLLNLAWILQGDSACL